MKKKRSELDKAIARMERSDRGVREHTLTVPILAAMIAVVCLLLGLAVWLALRGTGEVVHTGGEDTNYPYTWMVQKDGAILFTLRNGDDGGYEWSVADYNDETISVVREETEEEASTTTYLLTPLREGVCRLTFLRFRAGEVLEDGAFRLPVRVNIDGELQAEVTVEPGQVLSGISQDEGTANSSLTWSVGADGTVSVLVSHDLQAYYDWELELDEDLLLLKESDQSTRECRVSLSWREHFEETELVIVGTPRTNNANGGKNLPIIRYTVTLANTEDSLQVVKTEGSEADYKVPVPVLEPAVEIPENVEEPAQETENPTEEPEEPAQEEIVDGAASEKLNGKKS